MQSNKIFRILALAIILSLLTVAIPATPVLAAPVINISPTDGEIGDDVDIYGYDFGAGVGVYIYFSSDEANVGDSLDDEVNTYERVRTTTADSSGEIDTYFSVPDELTDGDKYENVRGGTYYVYATYAGSKLIRAVEEFEVEGVGGITIDPEEGLVGTEVEITGEGFGDREDIIIEYDGDELEIQSGDEETDRDGEFEDTTIIVPESTAGEHTITVTGDESDTEAEAVFTVEPQITIGPESGGAGITVTIDGTGFGNRRDVTIYFDNDKVDISGDDATDKYGSFEATFKVPALESGTYNVEVEDKDDNAEKVKFTIAIVPSASFSATSGYVGTEVTVSGSGFKANQSITITFADVGVGTVVSDDSGSFSSSFPVPSSAKGTYKVKVSDGVNTEESDFTVLTSASISPVTSATSPGHVGTELTISGIGFMAGKTVTINFDGTQVTTATVKPDGAFSATFNAPASIGGEHPIIATDGTMTGQFTFTMESTAPEVPAPLKPEMDVKAEAEVYFDWEDVTDPSGVTYTLQIASDEDFTSIVLEKENLTDSEYTLTKEEKLKSVTKKAPYYWRVKAIDGASNESGWTGRGSFYVGFSWAIPQWAIYTLFVFGVLLIFAFGYWLGRRSALYSY